MRLQVAERVTVVHNPPGQPCELCTGKEHARKVIRIDGVNGVKYHEMSYVRGCKRGREGLLGRCCPIHRFKLPTLIVCNYHNGE